MVLSMSAIDFSNWFSPDKPCVATTKGRLKQRHATVVKPTRKRDGWRFVIGIMVKMGLNSKVYTGACMNADVGFIALVSA